MTWVGLQQIMKGVLYIMNVGVHASETLGYVTEMDHHHHARVLPSQCHYLPNLARKCAGWTT